MLHHGGYAKNTMIHRDFANLYNFWKITVSHRDSDISSVTPDMFIISSFVKLGVVIIANNK